MWKARGVTFLLLMTTMSMSHGKLLPEESVPSRFLGTPRTVRIYLPPSYDSQPKRRYPVLYLHDGQNVFSSAGTNSCFGWGSWELDRTADRLIVEGRMQEIIMVGVDNTRSRYKEYRGRIYPGGSQKGRSKTSVEVDNARFEAYAGFLIEELKPKIDREYRTLKTSANTGVMGSSLGGICSISLAWEFPKTFGRAASLSGSFQIEKTNFVREVLMPYKGKPKPVRLYIDSGTIDFTGDDDGRRHTDTVWDELRRIGWKDGKNLCHYTDGRPMVEAELEQAGLRHDKWPEAKISQHNEFYWRVRAWRPFEFLFPPAKP